MLWLLNSLLLVALVSGSHPPIYNPSSQFSDLSSRVVNGTVVNPQNKYPWQVALFYELFNSLNLFCSGILIDTNWVLTAAHCFSTIYTTYYAMVGAYNMSALTGTVRILPVKSYVLHENYNGYQTEGYDIALVELSRSAELTTWVQPACLPCAGYITPNGTECYVTGWGFISTDGPASDTLLEGLLCVLDHEQCSQPDYWGDNVNKRHLCAGECGSSACLGDSGGPLNCPGVNTEWEVHGIVSFGSDNGCNYPKKPTVFTRVSCFIDWIEEKTGIDLKKWC